MRQVELSKRPAATEPDALHALLASFNLSFERIGLEACSLTAWLHSELTAAGWSTICIESRHAKAAMGAMPNKTDRNDARAIAQIMRTGWFKAVHVKTPTCRSWRSLLVARRAVLNEIRTIENVLGPSFVKRVSKSALPRGKTSLLEFWN